MTQLLPVTSDQAHPAATSHAPAKSEGAASLAPLPQAGGAGGGQQHFTIFSPRAQGAFLENLTVNGNVRLACRAAGVSPQTAYRARRKSPALAQRWDAALLAARTHAEGVLGERALDGVEEAIYYHGEEIARRRRYDSRLLLAHLARLDRLAERADVEALLPLLDEQIEALLRGEEPTEIAAEGASEKQPLDRVPCVPSCRTSPPDDGEERDGEMEEPDSEVGEQETDAQFADYLERVCRMERARPAGAPSVYELREDPDLDLEMVQLEAFEEGLEAWWTIRTEEELDERLESLSAYRRAP